VGEECGAVGRDIAGNCRRALEYQTFVRRINLFLTVVCRVPDTQSHPSSFTVQTESHWHSRLSIDATNPSSPVGLTAPRFGAHGANIMDLVNQ